MTYFQESDRQYWETFDWHKYANRYKGDKRGSVEDEQLNQRSTEDVCRVTKDEDPKELWYGGVRVGGSYQYNRDTGE